MGGAGMTTFIRWAGRMLADAARWRLRQRIDARTQPVLTK
jgi:hypothetical protein